MPNLYSVIANILATVEEKSAFLLRHRSNAMWDCNLSERRLPTDERLIGELDKVQRHTFDRVRDLGSATAPTLAAQNGRESGLGATAWNDCLSNLAARGLLIERRGGKPKPSILVWRLRDGSRLRPNRSRKALYQTRGEGAEPTEDSDSP